MGVEELRIRLPQHLSKWLKEFSEAIAMTPDQFIAHILESYYEVWRVGREWDVRLRPTAVAHGEGQAADPLLEGYLSSEPAARKYEYLLRRLVSWVRERGMALEDLDEGLAERFLGEYRVGKSLKNSTLTLYRRELRKFVAFARSQRRAPRPPQGPQGAGAH